MKAATRAGLRAALRGVRALLLDLDGVIVLKGEAVPGSIGAIADLERRGIPYRIVTNTSLVSRATLSRWATRLGGNIPPDRFQSALSATATHARRHFGDLPLFVITSDDARTEFTGLRLLTNDEAASPGARAAAGIVGDSPDELTQRNLNSAFRLVRNGATLIGMHRNAWWLTPDGPTLDSGAYLAGLEYATGVRATIVGKPSRPFFSLAVRSLRAEARDRGSPGPLRRADIAMIGDDVANDVHAAQRVGLRGVLVLTGKHALGDIRGRPPDAVAASLGDVVAALD